MDTDDRLNSWKEIATYLDRDVTTVQRWEKREGMPVHRHQHDRMGSVYAFRSELDGWVRSRQLQTSQESAASPVSTGRGWRGVVAAAAAVVFLAVGAAHVAPSD